MTVTAAKKPTHHAWNRGLEDNINATATSQNLRSVCPVPVEEANIVIQVSVQVPVSIIRVTWSLRVQCCVSAVTVPIATARGSADNFKSPRLTRTNRHQ